MPAAGNNLPCYMVHNPEYHILEGYILTGITITAQEKPYVMKFVRSLSVTWVVWLRLVLKSSIFRDITPSSPLKQNRSFGVTHYLHLQGGRINQARTQREAGSKRRLRYSHSTEPLVTTAVRTSSPTWYGFGCTVEVPPDARYECREQPYRVLNPHH
jgi:hypothetical protein